MTNTNMTATEARIVNQLLSHAFSLGYVVSVNDGEDWVVKTSNHRELIINALASTDCDMLAFREGPDSTKVIGKVWLIWGNDEDLISDNTDNAETNHLVDHLQLAKFASANAPAIVVVTIHAGAADPASRAVFGPFPTGTEASAWGFSTFPNNTAPNGASVTWCWEHLIPQTANVFDAIVAAID